MSAFLKSVQPVSFGDITDLTIRQRDGIESVASNLNFGSFGL